MKQRKKFQTILLALALPMMVATASAQSTQKAKTTMPAAPKKTNQLKGGVYDVVEVLPKFPGGMEAMGTFLSKNIKYPSADREKGLQGKVVAQFVVEPDGSLTNIKVVRAPSTTMGAEAVRVLKMSPKWKPGINNGKPVRTVYTIPVSFALSES
jgi:TonB family protein